MTHSRRKTRRSPGSAFATTRRATSCVTGCRSGMACCSTTRAVPSRALSASAGWRLRPTLIPRSLIRSHPTTIPSQNLKSRGGCWWTYRCCARYPTSPCPPCVHGQNWQICRCCARATACPSRPSSRSTGKPSPAGSAKPVRRRTLAGFAGGANRTGL